MPSFIRSTLIVMGVLLCFCGSVRGQLGEEVLDAVWPERPRVPLFPDAIAPDAPNAAARYLWLFARFDERLATLSRPFVGGSLKFEFRAGSEHAGTEEELRKLLVEQQEWIRSLIEATKVERFDLHYASGVAFKHPGDTTRENVFRDAQGALAVLRADAVRLWIEGSKADAAERMIASFRLLKHFMDPRTPLTDMVMTNMTVLVVQTITMKMLDEGGFPTAQRVELRRVLDKLDPRDPMQLRAAWSRVQRSHRQFCDEQLADGKVGDPLLVMLAMSRWQSLLGKALMMRVEKKRTGGVLTDDPEVEEGMEEAARVLEGMTHEKMSARLKTIDELTRRVQAAWEADDAAAKLEEIEKEIEAEETGLAIFILPSPRGVQGDWKESVELIESLRKRLRD